MELTADIKKLYPFESHFLKLNGHQLHYVDEGEGENTIVMVHGNPTWSFYYRNLISHFSKNYRVIAIDHMGCGLSDKPLDYNYTLEQRVNDLSDLINHIGLKKYSMIVHDWGGAIGFGHAVQNTENIENIVILNTAAFRSNSIPRSISLCKNKLFGAFLVQYLNGFCFPATFMTTVKKLKSEIKNAYLAPYGNAKERKAISEFVRDIPLDEKHPSYLYLKNIEEKLPSLKGPKLILWGGQDFCFHDEFFQKWRSIYPQAKFTYYKDAGHYVIEDKKEETIEEIESFFKSSIVSTEELQ